MDSILSIVFYLIYMFFSIRFSITAEFVNPTEQIYGIFVGFSLSNLIERILFRITYKVTGIVTTEYDSKERKSAIHWKIRAALIVLAILLGKTGIYKLLLVPLTHVIYTTSKNLYNVLINHLLEIIFGKYL